MKKLIILFILSYLLSGCISLNRCIEKYPEYYIPKDSIVVKVDTLIKDSLVYELPDSSWVRALLECNEFGNILLIELEDVKTTNKKLLLQLKGKNISGKQYQLNVKCKIDSMAVYAAYKTVHYSKESYIIKPQAVPYKVEFVPKFYKFTMWWFVVSAALLLSVTFYKLIKK